MSIYSEGAMNLDDFADVLYPHDPKQRELLEKIVNLMNELDYHIALLDAETSTRQ